jgi:hypothetical protein
MLRRPKLLDYFSCDLVNEQLAEVMARDAHVQAVEGISGVWGLSRFL